MSTPDEAARAQIAAQAELRSTAPFGGATSEQAGQQLASSGAGATEVDAAALLALVQQLQDTVTRIEDERAAERTAGLPDVVVRAEQILADLQHRHGALSAGSPLAPAVERAGKLVDAARSAVESGDPAELLTLAGALAKHLARVSSAASSADISYALQLADTDLPEAAAAIRAPSAAPAGRVPHAAAQRPQQPAPARGPVTHTF